VDHSLPYKLKINKQTKQKNNEIVQIPSSKTFLDCSVLQAYYSMQFGTFLLPAKFEDPHSFKTLNIFHHRASTLLRRHCTSLESGMKVLKQVTAYACFTNILWAIRSGYSNGSQLKG